MLFDNAFNDISPKFCRVPDYQTNTDIQIVEFGYNRVPAGLCQITKRDVYILHYVVDGCGVFMDQRFDSGNGYLVIPHELEKITADENNPYESYWITFKGNLAPEILKNCNLTKKNSVFPFSRCNECADIIKKALFETNYANEYEEAYNMRSAFYKVISVHTKDIEKSTTSINQTARNIAVYIEKQYFQELKITTLANLFNISRSYLYLIFKQEYGISPQEYLISYRIEKAKQLLTDNQRLLSIKEVSFAIGFDNPLYFSRIFNKKTGMSPSKYRKIKNKTPNAQ